MVILGSIDRGKSSKKRATGPYQLASPTLCDLCTFCSNTVLSLLTTTTRISQPDKEVNIGQPGLFKPFATSVVEPCIGETQKPFQTLLDLRTSTVET